jgi:hypothetical protein
MSDYGEAGANREAATRDGRGTGGGYVMDGDDLPVD